MTPAQTNGRVIRGQNAISHPGRGAAPQAAAVVDKHAAGPPMEAPIRRIFYLSSEGTHQARLTAGLCWCMKAWDTDQPVEYHGALNSAVVVLLERNFRRKATAEPLQCRVQHPSCKVRRLLLSDGGGSRQEHEVFPAPNPAVLAEIAGADAVVYAMGSLYTSICPSLVLQVFP